MASVVDLAVSLRGKLRAPVFLSKALFVPLLLAPGVACLETKVCLEERGCADQASIIVRRADGATPPMGVVMDVDGRRVTCQVPPRAAGGVICDDNRVQVQHREVTGGRFEQVITLPGTPRQIAVTLMADNTVVAQRSFEVVYMEIRPNGEHCEPVCKQRSETWEL